MCIRDRCHAIEGGFFVNSLGEVEEYFGEEQLPFLLGPVGKFFIEPFDASSDTEWKHVIESAVPRIKGNSNGRQGRGIGSPDVMAPIRSRSIRSSRQEEIEIVPAVTTISYTSEPEQNEKITLHKSYEFATTQNPEHPYMRVRGTGTIVFDTKIGMPQSLEYNAVLESFVEAGSVRFPLKVTYTLLDVEKVRQEREQYEKRELEDEQKRVRELTVPDPELVDRLLEEVKYSGLTLAVHQPLEYLARVAIVEEKRRKVLDLSYYCFKKRAQLSEYAAGAAFAHWSTEKQLNELSEIIAYLEGHRMNRAHAAVVKRLGTFKSERAHLMLIDAVERTSVTAEATAAMIAVGAPMEAVILKRYDRLTTDASEIACLKVLKEVGTEKSLPLLEKMAASEKYWHRSAAQEALKRIQDE